MYDTLRSQPTSCEPVPMNPTEESLQSTVGEILEMVRCCRGISNSIENGLFGPRVQNDNKKETNICCMVDALKEVRHILGETLNVLEAVSRKI